MTTFQSIECWAGNAKNSWGDKVSDFNALQYPSSPAHYESSKPKNGQYD